MPTGFFNTFFYVPLYNALTFLISIIPGHNAGLAVIILTIIIRLVLFPLSKKAIKTQIIMKQIEPEMQKIREKYTDKTEQGQKILQLYKEKGINPFAGFLLLIIQLPILIELYRVFQSGLPKINPAYLYSFVAAPESVSMMFLGADLGQKSIILAVIAVVTQYIQINLSLPKSKKKEGSTSFQQDLAHSMNVQMRYIFPLVLFPIAYISSVIAIYLATTNIFTTLQEIFVKRKMVREYEKKS